MAVAMAATYLAARRAHAADPLDPGLTAAMCVSCAQLFVDSLDTWVSQEACAGDRKAAKKRASRARESAQLVIRADAGSQDAPLKGNSAACNAFSAWLSMLEPAGPVLGPGAGPAAVGEGVPLPLALVFGRAATLATEGGDPGAAQAQLTATIKACGGVKSFLTCTQDVHSVGAASTLLASGGGISRAGVRSLLAAAGLVGSKRSRADEPTTCSGPLEGPICADGSSGHGGEEEWTGDGEGSHGGAAYEEAVAPGAASAGFVDHDRDVGAGAGAGRATAPTVQRPLQVDDDVYATTPHFGRLKVLGASGCTVAVKLTGRDLLEAGAARYPHLAPLMPLNAHAPRNGPSSGSPPTKLLTPDHAVPIVFGGDPWRGRVRHEETVPVDHPVHLALRAHNMIGSHPCVARCVDACLAKEDPHLLMEFVPHSGPYTR
jgi:hypothetical protein